MFFAIIIPLGLLLVLGDLVVAAIGFIVAALIIGVLVLLATGVAYDVMTANPLLGISGVLAVCFLGVRIYIVRKRREVREQVRNEAEWKARVKFCAKQDLRADQARRLSLGR